MGGSPTLWNLGISMEYDGSQEGANKSQVEAGENLKTSLEDVLEDVSGATWPKT
jgi:hypothetical protein